MGAASKKVWKISGHDGPQQIFEKTLPESSLSEGQMITLLQRLVARSLSPDEIVRASLRLNSKEYSPLLEPRIGARKSSSDRFTIMVGTDPHYMASIWDEGEQSV
jgi:hypothetical protein